MGPVNVCFVGYNISMPVPAAVAAIISSVINTVSELPPAQQQLELYAAVSRTFPAEAKKGELTPPVQQQLQISGQTLPASQGLQIRNTQNLIVMPDTLQQTTPVRYQLDAMGNVFRIWILSAAEQAAPDPQQ